MELLCIVPTWLKLWNVLRIFFHTYLRIKSNYLPLFFFKFSYSWSKNTLYSWVEIVEYLSAFSKAEKFQNVNSVKVEKVQKGNGHWFYWIHLYFRKKTYYLILFECSESTIILNEWQPNKGAYTDTTTKSVVAIGIL